MRFGLVLIAEMGFGIAGSGCWGMARHFNAQESSATWQGWRKCLARRQAGHSRVKQSSVDFSLTSIAPHNTPLKPIYHPPFYPLHGDSQLHNHPNTQITLQILRWSSSLFHRRWPQWLFVSHTQRHGFSLSEMELSRPFAPPS